MATLSRSPSTTFDSTKPHAVRELSELSFSDVGLNAIVITFRSESTLSLVEMISSSTTRTTVLSKRANTLSMLSSRISYRYLSLSLMGLYTRSPGIFKRIPPLASSHSLRVTMNKVALQAFIDNFDLQILHETKSTRRCDSSCERLTTQKFSMGHRRRRAERFEIQI